MEGAEQIGLEGEREMRDKKMREHHKQSEQFGLFKMDGSKDERLFTDAKLLHLR